MNKIEFPPGSYDPACIVSTDVLRHSGGEEFKVHTFNFDKAGTTFTLMNISQGAPFYGGTIECAEGFIKRCFTLIREIPEDVPAIITVEYVDPPRPATPAEVLHPVDQRFLDWARKRVNG